MSEPVNKHQPIEDLRALLRPFKTSDADTVTYETGLSSNQQWAMVADEICTLIIKTAAHNRKKYNPEYLELASFALRKMALSTPHVNGLLEKVDAETLYYFRFIKAAWEKYEPTISMQTGLPHIPKKPMELWGFILNATGNANVREYIPWLMQQFIESEPIMLLTDVQNVIKNLALLSTLPHAAPSSVQGMDVAQLQRGVQSFTRKELLPDELVELIKILRKRGLKIKRHSLSGKSKKFADSLPKDRKRLAKKVLSRFSRCQQPRVIKLLKKMKKKDGFGKIWIQTCTALRRYKISIKDIQILYHGKHGAVVTVRQRTRNFHAGKVIGLGTEMCTVRRGYFRKYIKSGDLTVYMPSGGRCFQYHSNRRKRKKRHAEMLLGSKNSTLRVKDKEKLEPLMQCIKRKHRPRKPLDDFIRRSIDLG